jgi:predicted nucleotidyltransferase component of viral defense system
MNDGKIKKMAASVHDRLLKLAKKEDRPFNELLQYYAMERLLHRLSKSKHSAQFVLKGALMFQVLDLAHSRPTKDIDLEGLFENNVNLVKSLIKDICETTVEDDGLIFNTNSITADHIMEDAAYRGIRVRLTSNLESAKITMQLDIGFGDKIIPKAEKVSYPSLLDFPSVELQIYTRESAIAEKFEAMVKLGELNSRMRDFYDIWEFSRSFEFSGIVLTEAIDATFNNRETQIPEMPICLTFNFYESKEKQKLWNTFLKKTRLSKISEFSQVCIDIREFLLPVVTALRNGIKIEGHWEPKDKWK